MLLRNLILGCLLLTVALPAWGDKLKSPSSSMKTQRAEASTAPIADTSPTAKPAPAAIKFSEVAYTIENLELVIQDLDAVDRVADEGLSRETVAAIQKRFAAAVKLLSEILSDEKLGDDERNKLARELASSLGEVFFTIVRFHGEDKIANPEKLTNLDRARAVLREFVLDFTSLVKFKRPGLAAEGGVVWGVADRVRRDSLSQAVIAEMQTLTTEAILTLDDKDPLKAKSQNYWSELVAAKALGIRQARLSAQKATAYTYLGLAVWGLFGPMVDVVGLVDGRSENSLFVSSTMYANFWFWTAVTKRASVSAETVNELRRWLAMLKNEETAAPVTRLRDRVWAAGRRCAERLTAGAKKATP